MTAEEYASLEMTVDSSPEKPNAIIDTMQEEHTEEFAEISLAEPKDDDTVDSSEAVSLLQVAENLNHVSLETHDIPKETIETADVDSVEINEQGTALADGITIEDDKSDITVDNEPYKPDAAEEPHLLKDEDHLIETVVHGDELNEMMEQDPVSSSESQDKSVIEESMSSTQSEGTEKHTVSKLKYRVFFFFL